MTPDKGKEKAPETFEKDDFDEANLHDFASDLHEGSEEVSQSSESIGSALDDADADKQGRGGAGAGAGARDRERKRKSPVKRTTTTESMANLGDGLSLFARAAAIVDEHHAGRSSSSGEE